MGNYYCPDCGKTFEWPHIYVEMHGFTYGPGETWSVCPYCKEPGWGDTTYCEECGEPHLAEELTDNFCEACYAKAEAEAGAKVEEREATTH